MLKRRRLGQRIGGVLLRKGEAAAHRAVGGGAKVGREREGRGATACLAHLIARHGAVYFDALVEDDATVILWRRDLLCWFLLGLAPSPGLVAVASGGGLHAGQHRCPSSRLCRWGSLGRDGAVLQRIGGFKHTIQTSIRPRLEWLLVIDAVAYARGVVGAVGDGVLLKRGLNVLWGGRAVGAETHRLDGAGGHLAHWLEATWIGGATGRDVRGDHDARGGAVPAVGRINIRNCTNGCRRPCLAVTPVRQPFPLH
ncbi:hypothetical protein AGDE_16752 [Angomonas deanei]|nr:hypothetical protein AGDE_16752 [Angomonas deanei]|eukprot:EPY16281.1 hypothetical protein AGDE_16752 [Angomonas deanei]